jgi:hypothetical protein
MKPARHTQLAQPIEPNSVNRRYSTANGGTPASRGRQDNPTQPRARVASPQPVPPKNKMRPPPFEEYKNDTHPGRPKRQKTRHTTTHLKPRVRVDLERKAADEGLSVSATLAAITEWYFQQSLYEQNTATMDTAMDKAVGRHMRVHSDREASLQARNIQKTELVFQIVTQILSKMPGMDGRKLETFMNEADEQARASISRITAGEKKVIADETAAFEKGGSSNA